MRIMHCADLHLDARMSANLTPEKGKERRRELYAAFLRMVQFADVKSVDAILIAGDLFDKNSISLASADKILSVIQEYSRIQFFYLKGNHDAEVQLRGMEEDLPNFHCFSSEHWTSYPLGEGKVIITGVELNEGNNRSVYDELDLDTGAYNIVVLHGQTEDTGITEKTYGRKKEAVVALRSLQNKGIDYLALGHIHKRQTGRLDGRGIWCYPGCLEGRGFDECGPHGCILLELDPDTHDTSMAFVPIAKRILHEITVDVSACCNSYEILALLKEGLDRKSCREEDLVKVILEGEVDAVCEIATDYLGKQLEDRYYYVTVENRTRVKIDYRELMADPSLKGAFVRCVTKDPLLTPEERTEVIRLGIRLLMGVGGYED